MMEYLLPQVEVVVLVPPSDEQMNHRCPFSLLNKEKMSNWLGVEHQPVFPLKRLEQLFFHLGEFFRVGKKGSKVHQKLSK